MTLEDLEPGYSFGEIEVGATLKRVELYKKSTKDEFDYKESLPPLICLATALGTLVERIPNGGSMLHTIQQVEWLGESNVGEEITTNPTVKLVRKKAGKLFVNIDLDFFCEDHPVLKAKTSLVIG